MKKILRKIIPWIRIFNPPKWIKNSGRHIEVKASHDAFRKYWIVKKGRTYMYKIVAENTGQGTCKTKYYRKIRIK